MYKHYKQSLTIN